MEVEVAKNESEKHLDIGEETAFSQASKKKKLIATFAIYYVNFSLGMAYNLFGPSLTDFSNKFDTDIANVSIVFAVTTGAYLAGALLGGILSNLFNRQTVAIGGVTVGTTALFLLPHISTIWWYYVLACLIGIFVGTYDIIQIAWIFDIWRHKCPPYILAQHFSYSLGTVVPPLLLSPFLSDENDEDEQTTTTSKIFLEGVNGSSSTELPNTTDTTTNADLWIPFTIAGSILGFALVVLTSFFIIFRTEYKSYNDKKKMEQVLQAATDTNEITTNKTKSKFQFPEREKVILVALSCCCIASLQGYELNTMNFVPTFAQFCKVELTQSQGADLLFGLTGTFCICRAIGIILVLKVPPHFIILGNFTFIMLANTLFLVAGGQEKGESTLLWVASVVMGVGMSTTYPAYFAFIEKYLFITDTIVTFILVCAGTVATIYPIIVGNSVEHNPNIMIYINYFSMSVFAIAFCTTFWLTYVKSRRARKGLEMNQMNNSGSSGPNDHGAVVVRSEKDKTF